MIIYVYGEDTFRSRAYATEQIEKFKKARDPAGYNVAELDGAKESLGKILEGLLATPFLAERRMVLIANILSSSDKTLLGEIIERIKNQKIPDSTAVLFWQAEPLSKVKEAKELQALLQKEKYVQEFPLLVGIKLQGWIDQEFKKRGGSISPAGAAYLAQNIGGEMWLLNSLINQVSAYKNGVRVEQPDVELFLDHKGSETIFNAIDAVAEGNTKKAFLLLMAQRAEGQEEGFIFNMLLRQFKILLEIKDCQERENNPSPDTIAKLLGLAPFVVKKSAGVARRFSLAELEEKYRELVQIDLGMKTGYADQGTLVDRFVAAS